MMTPPATPRAGVMHALFGWIPEPRIVRGLLLVMYVTMFCVGASTLVDPPQTIAGAAGPLLMGALASFVLVGAFLASLAVLPGILWLERCGIVAMILGISAYGFVLLNLGPPATGPSDLLLGIVAASMLGLLVRYAQSPKADIDPER